jgi:hypothetical protein
MTKPNQASLHPAASPVYLTASVIHTLICTLPAGTAYSIGVVLITLFTGQRAHRQGSLARAALPYVVHLRWGWHRVERAMARGKFSLDEWFDRALAWCFAHLPVEPVRLGERSVHAIDSSTIVRWRAGERCGLLGKGYCHRARRAVKATIVAVLTSIVRVQGVRVGLVRRTRFGSSCAQAVAEVFAALPPSTEKRLLVVDAGIASHEQFQAATVQDALVGRLRQNVVLRRAPRPKVPGQRGRPPVHGPVIHPGAAQPEGEADEDRIVPCEQRLIRVRRWNQLHHEETPKTIIDVVRVDDPLYPRPLLIGTTARELTSADTRAAYGHRWPVETNFYVAQGTCAMEKPRAWSERAIERRIGLALLVGTLLKAIAAACEPLAMGPWDREAVRSAGRLANHLDLHAGNLTALALKNIVPRKYCKMADAKHTADLQLPIAA